MLIGNLIKYFNPQAKQVAHSEGRQPKGIVGLVVDVEKVFGQNVGGMIRVVFNGFTLPRWVHEQDCEVLYEGR